jgi:hypothetical protein
MKNASVDPILAEVHMIKDAISAEFRHDVSALCRYLQEREVESVAAGLKHLPLPSARPMKRPRSKTIMRRRQPVVKASG